LSERVQLALEFGEQAHLDGGVVSAAEALANVIGKGRKSDDLF